MPVHTCVAECAWNGLCKYATGCILFFWGCTLVEFIYLIFTRMPGGVTVGDLGLCCCVPCPSSAIISLCLSTLHKPSRPHFVSDYNSSLWGQRVNVCMCVFICWAIFEIWGLCPVSNKNWFCRMPVHTFVSECAWNGGCICHWGHPFRGEPVWPSDKALGW